MKKLLDFGKAQHLLETIRIEKVYPLSVAEGCQSGEVFADDTRTPSSVLYWHYCGFGFVAGRCDGEVQNWLHAMMQNPLEGHSGRLAIQTEDDGLFRDFQDVSRRERYVFGFEGSSGMPEIPAGCQIVPVTQRNYHDLKGRIVPDFSWRNSEEFLKNGFGYYLTRDDEVLACAFSSAVSSEYVDIGVETGEKYRGKGYGKIVSAAMVEETLRQGKEPEWSCDVLNEGSMRLACSVGFRVTGTHPWYKIG